jgi:glycerol-3-phosphate dehydrogenase
MNVSIALTAARRGASIANHTEVIRLLKKKIIQGNATGDIGI